MVSKELADKLTGIACKQLEAGVKYRQQRLDTIKEFEDLYYNKKIATIDRNIDIPFPFVAGHVDTFLAKIDAPPKVDFGPTEESDIQLAEKITAAFRLDSSSMLAAWDRKDRSEKKLAAISGVGISKIYAESPGGKYYACYDVIDYNDFVCEGTQGHLEDNMYCGQMNIFRTRAELQNRAENGTYNAEQVNLLLSRTGQEDYKVNDDLYGNKVNRLQAMGLTPELTTYVGQEVVNLTEWCMDYENTRYYLVFEYNTGTWVRAEKLVDVFPCGARYPKGIYPYVAWHINPDAFNFWSKGEVDDIAPVAAALKIILDQTLINTMRQNQPGRAIDPSVFPDPNALEWRRPDDIIITKPGKNPAEGIYTFQTPSITGSINLVQYLDNFLGQKTGVTADAQGAADKDVKVGVYYGNLQQVSDRMGLIEKNYNESYAEKGYRYYWGMRTHLNENKLVRMIGKQGVQWDVLTKSELKDSDDFDVIVSGGSRQAELDAVKQKQQAEALAQVKNNPVASKLLSMKWLFENELRLGGFDDEQIQQAFDIQGEESRELMQEASKAIQDILLGKTPRLNRGANAAFLQKILDFDIDKLDYIKLDKQGNVVGIDEKMKKKSEALQAYANAHYDIVIENTLRKAKIKAQMESEQMQKTMMDSGQVPHVEQPSESLPMGTESGTAQMSQELSQTLS